MATRRPQRDVRTRSAPDPPPPVVSGAVLPESGGIRSNTLIRFIVHGLPVPQGSTRAWVVNGKPIITTTAKGLSTWRRLVADVAQRFAPPEPWDGPVRLELDFGLPKPKSAPKNRRVWPDKRPDLDKLTRAVLDALSYVVFADDSQVVEIAARKEYGPPGVAIEIRKVQDVEIASE